MEIEIDLGSLQKAKKKVWVKATSKRKGHYRQQDVGKKSFGTAENVKKKILGYMTSGKVDLPDASIEDLNGILKGLDNTLGKYGLKLNTMEFDEERSGCIGRYDEDENSVYFTKDKLLNLKRDIKVGTENFKKI